jgi:hypothetical protein
LREHLDVIQELKQQFEVRAKTEESARSIYLKLSELEYRMRDLTKRLESERIIAGVPTVMAAVPPPEAYSTYLLSRVAIWSGVIALVSILVLAYVFRKKA